MKSLVISLSILFMCAGVSYAGDWIYADLTWDDSPDQVMEKLKKNAADVCWSVKKSGSPRRSLIGLGALVTREHESALWSRGTVFNKGPLWQYYEHVIN
ncbi:MAG: hypothetical protein JSV21_08905, partial [Nitrospirota bacterium]